MRFDGDKWVGNAGHLTAIVFLVCLCACMLLATSMFASYVLFGVSW